MPVGKGSIERIRKARNDAGGEKVKAQPVKRSRPQKTSAPKAASEKAAVEREKAGESRKIPVTEGYYSGNDLPAYLL